jgi:UDP-N-acetylmuramoyl-L-alanyl-D-glutamate--2,6-diaminopimelate ligase
MRLSDLLDKDPSTRVIAPANGKPASAPDMLEITGLTADSREVKPGYLFAALPGTARDGANFITQAIEKGAVAVLGVQGARRRKGADRTVFLANGNPRKVLAHMAARFYGRQPETIVAVTGTNGKTSVASFCRQIWLALGERAASMGTLGIVGHDFQQGLAHTTPDPVTIHKVLADLAGRGIKCLSMEASSHGLAQFRLDGVDIAAAAFTNLTRDHLDYHASVDDYRYAKLRLFGEVMGRGGVAVINADSDIFDMTKSVALARGQRVFSVGQAGTDLRLADVRPKADGQHLKIECRGKTYEVDLPLVGIFQASNAAMAAGLVIGAGWPEDKVLPMLAKLRGARGRMELAAKAKDGAPVYVDYAHTPDALETVLNALRPHVKGKLHIVFGCGGDRDRGKRPEMGAVAARLADRVIVTDDNPRSEDPATIRAAIMEGCPRAENIGDRAAAIRAGIAGLKAGDLLVVAGKGHETGQKIGDKVLPFNDAEEVRKAVAEAGEGGGAHG